VSQQELLGHLVAVLESAGIEYMLTGSVVSSLHGEPRATHDIDVVVVIEQGSVETFTSSFLFPAFYLDVQSAVSAIAEKGMFNVIDTREGVKIDFWMLTDEPFDRTRFSRKRKKSLFGKEVYVASPEDTIISKLRWVSLFGGSEKHFTDAVRVYEVQSGNLDTRYIEKWVRELRLESLWKALVGEAEPPTMG